jgi:hypothetical protein
MHYLIGLGNHELKSQIKQYPKKKLNKRVGEIKKNVYILSQLNL